MREKSIWGRVTSLVGKGESTLRELPTHTRRCQAGHPMALDWTDCPYCKAGRARNPGAGVEQVLDTPRAPEQAVPDPSATISRTRVHGETRVAGRPLVGVLFTFSWMPMGQLFPLYDGRNYAGTAPTTREGQRTDILVSEDPAMSGTHFLILYQQATGQYRIVDENSANGTFLDGVPVDSNGAELPDDARIVAGNTLFTFRQVRRPPADAERPPETHYRRAAAGEKDEGRR